MRSVLNYMVCTAAIMVAIALILGGGWWSLAGFLWCGLMYVSGELFPALWRSYWRENMRILKHFNCL